MTHKEISLAVGSLLHDVGKVIYRAENEHRKHSQIGYEYLKESVGIENQDVLDCVRYHHAANLVNAAVADDSLAYITYISDNIAAGIDRREKDSEESGFEIHTPLSPVFNLLNGNDAEMYYSPYKTNVEAEINYPQQEKIKFEKEKYSDIKNNITDNLKGIEWNEEYINSLLEVMEANMVFIPSSTARGEVPDISLYDHSKITAAIAGCILKYLEESRINDYKAELYLSAEKFYEKKVFALASLDISGIQDFIYTIHSEKALRMLRARSFYIEILMEHIIDSILEELSLSRTNLIYSGGGHCYLLIPNTEDSISKFEYCVNTANDWFISQFKGALYVAGAYVECSGNILRNIPEGSYSDVYRELSKKLSKIKLHRYSADQIRILNSDDGSNHLKECKICHSMRNVNGNDVCGICDRLLDFSGSVLYEKFFCIRKTTDKDILPLPFGCGLIGADEDKLKELMDKDVDFVRAYGKNKAYTGKHIATKLWVGDYSSGDSFEELADKAEGIHRIGILRADVDNLGQAFVEGFNNKDNKNRYATLSRTATLSRQLSLFFKLHINSILANPKYTLTGGNKKARAASIVYSGGDDLFIVGAWDDIIELSVDLQEEFCRFTEGTLHISGGIGVYSAHYPAHIMAVETEYKVEASKKEINKNAITLLGDSTHKWDAFRERVLDDKFKLIYDFFKTTEDYGKSFIYKLLELIRRQDDRINFARYVYLLSRMEPSESAEPEIKRKYKLFSKKMVEWIDTDADRAELCTAIELYVYTIRERQE
ncbi:MAG: type III-A CRISPR-associated protein Cas10/Csm1 [Lachnospiraceae bacterium]|nr:type III-A CRISPR-associated protein Cas10/Csm1 [Lachnospiraceae bacterium]